MLTRRSGGISAFLAPGGRAISSSPLAAPTRPAADPPLPAGSPRVSVVIPAKNEARNLPGLLAELPDGLHEVVLVDGASVDGTVQAALRARPDTVVVQQTRTGKGNALACGFAACTGDVIVMLDADGSADPAEIPRFVAALVGGADFAKGSRFLPGGGSCDLTRLRRLGNSALAFLMNRMYRTSYTDLCYGYNAFWRSRVESFALPAAAGTKAAHGDGFEIETLLATRVANARLAVAEVASYERERRFGESHLNTWRDGWRVLRTIVREWRAAVRRPAADTGPGMNVRADGSSAAVGRPGARRIPLRLRERDDHLLRTGHLLTLSALLTSGIGLLYWAVATRTYGPETVGAAYAAVAVMTFLAGVGHLNLSNVLIRFIPGAGARSRRLVTTAYGAAALGTLIAASVFVLLVPTLSPGLAFLHSPALGAAFVLGTVAYAVFMAQDGVLTGLRRSGWIVLENAGFALAKIALIIVLAGTALRAHGILLSWIIALVAATIVTNSFIYTRMFGRTQESDSPRADGDRVARVGLRYMSADYVGQMFWMAAMSLPPILVLNRLGAEQSAYFSLAWLIAHLLHMVSINMGLSLVVEAARNPGRIELFRNVLRHTGVLLVVCVAALIVVAPLILRVFGRHYVDSGTGLLRLLALSALPNLVLVTAVSVARAEQRMKLVLVVYASTCALVLGLTVALLPVMGVNGAGAAWLVALSVVAAVLLWRRDLWLPHGARPESDQGTR